MNWSKELPTTKGLYWFYGWKGRFQNYYGEDLEAQLFSIEILKTSNHKLIYVDKFHNEFLETSKLYGCWLKVELEFPSIDKEDFKPFEL